MLIERDMGQSLSSLEQAIQPPSRQLQNENRASSRRRPELHSAQIGYQADTFPALALNAVLTV